MAGTTPPSKSSTPYYPAPVASNTSKTFPCEFVTQPGVRAIFSEREAEAAKADINTLKAADPTLAAHCEFVTDATRLKELRVPGAKAAVVTDVAGRMWPYKFVTGVVENLILDHEMGSRFNLQTHTPVTSLERTSDGQGWRVVTERGCVETSQVLLATNGWTSHLLPAWADLVVPCRGQMSALKPSDELRDSHRLETSFGFMGPAMHDYLIQRPNSGGGHLMFGGGGMYGLALGNGDDSLIDTKATTYLKESLPLLLGTKDKTGLEVETIWSGVMGFSRDELPLIGPVPKNDGLFVAVGFTGHGMPNTWLCGHAVAEMMSGVAKGKDEQHAIRSATQATGLPRSYLLTPERLREMKRRPRVQELEKYASMNGAKCRVL